MLYYILHIVVLYYIILYMCFFIYTIHIAEVRWPWDCRTKFCAQPISMRLARCRWTSLAEFLRAGYRLVAGPARHGIPWRGVPPPQPGSDSPAQAAWSPCSACRPRARPLSRRWPSGSATPCTWPPRDSHDTRPWFAPGSRCLFPHFKAVGTIFVGLKPHIGVDCGILVDC